MHHVAVWGSIVMWFVFLGVYSHFWPTFPIAEVMVGQDVKLFGSFVFYMVFVLAPSVAMLPDLLKTVSVLSTGGGGSYAEYTFKRSNVSAQGREE